MYMSEFLFYLLLYYYFIIILLLFYYYFIIILLLFYYYSIIILLLVVVLFYYHLYAIEYTCAFSINSIPIFDFSSTITSQEYPGRQRAPEAAATMSRPCLALISNYPQPAIYPLQKRRLVQGSRGLRWCRR